MGRVVCIILALAAVALKRSESKTCDAYIPCRTDADCWNGPGFRCAEGAYENGTMSGKFVCVCGGEKGGELTAPDGIPRKYFCTLDGYTTNKIRLCLIQPGSPCWPLEEAIENLHEEGLPLSEFSLHQSNLDSLRHFHCGNGFCEDSGFDELPTCENVGNYFKKTEDKDEYFKIRGL